MRVGVSVARILHVCYYFKSLIAGRKRSGSRDGGIP